MDGEYFHHVLRQLTLLVKSSSASIARLQENCGLAGFSKFLFTVATAILKLRKMKAKSYLNVVAWLIVPSEWVGGDSLCIASLFCLPRGGKKVLSLE